MIICLAGGHNLRVLASVKGTFAVRSAQRRAHVRTLEYMAGVQDAFRDENHISMCAGEGTIADEPTLGACVYSTKRHAEAWLLPQVA